jgi:hypothetical protein
VAGLGPAIATNGPEVELAWADATNTSMSFTSTAYLY